MTAKQIADVVKALDIDFWWMISEDGDCTNWWNKIGIRRRLIAHRWIQYRLNLMYLNEGYLKNPSTTLKITKWTNSAILFLSMLATHIVVLTTLSKRLTKRTIHVLLIRDKIFVVPQQQRYLERCFYSLDFAVFVWTIFKVCLKQILLDMGPVADTHLE